MSDNGLLDIKNQIWHHRSIRRNVVDLQVAADKAGVRLPITDIREAEKLLASLDNKVKRKKSTIDPAAIARYNAAHHSWFQTQYPACYKDGHYITPLMPDTGTSNGLTRFIVQLLTWCGHFANRTGNEGRVIIKDGDPIRIPSSSKKGMQDIDCNLKHPQHQFGIPWKIEIKIGKDTHKQKQKEFGAKVSNTGGVYSVVKTVEDFFEQLDKLLLVIPQQKSIFEQ
jgi:hypothetical protein